MLVREIDAIKKSPVEPTLLIAKAQCTVFSAHNSEVVSELWGQGHEQADLGPRWVRVRHNRLEDKPTWFEVVKDVAPGS